MGSRNLRPDLKAKFYTGALDGVTDDDFIEFYEKFLVATFKGCGLHVFVSFGSKCNTK